MSNCDYQIHQTLSESTWHAMGNQQSGAGGGGKDKGEQKEKKKYEPPVPTRSVALDTEYLANLQYLSGAVLARRGRR